MKTSCITKLSVVALASIALSALSPASRAQANAVDFAAVINTTDPCTNSGVTVHGTTSLSISESGRGVIVLEQFFGREYGYEVHYHGRGEFEGPQPSYDILVHGGFEGRSNFRSRAVDRIFAEDGFSPTGDRFQRMNNTCR